MRKLRNAGFGAHINERGKGERRNGNDITSNEYVITKSFVANNILPKESYVIPHQPKRISDSGGVATGEMDNEADIVECVLDAYDVLRTCGKKVSAITQQIMSNIAKECEREQIMDIMEFVHRIPDDPANIMRTTDQADMNVSSGRLGVRRLCAWSSLSKAARFDMGEEEDFDE